MKLYKFRSFNNSEFTFDIFINNRLYCANYESLNDPFEGQLVSLIPCGGGGGPLGGGLLNGGLLGGGFLGGSLLGGDGGVRPQPQSIKDLPNYSDKVKICSLSQDFSDVRMWAHYSGGHEGVAIEIQFDEANENLVKIDYQDGLRRIYRGLLEKMPLEELLSYKTSHWAYEKEWRLIQEEDYYDIAGKISAVYLGCRVSLLNKTLMQRILPSVRPLIAIF